MTNIRLRRGNKADLPASAPSGMPLWCEDTKELYMGTGTGVYKFEISGNDLPLSKLWISSDYLATGVAIASVPAYIDLNNCMVQLLLKCASPQGGYSVGDIAPFNYSSGSDSDWNDACIDFTARTLSAMNGNTLFIANKNSSGFFYGAPANWRFVFKVLY